MVTKLEVLAMYNTKRGTNYSLSSLGAALVMEALKEEYKAYKQSLIVDEVLT